MPTRIGVPARVCDTCRATTFLRSRPSGVAIAEGARYLLVGSCMHTTMSWYENARALSHSEVYPSETAALEDQQRATAHSWKVQQRTVAESDADNAPQRIN